MIGIRRLRPAFVLAPLALSTLFATGSARASTSGTTPLVDGEPGIWIDNCPYDARRPHAMRCLSRTLMARSEAQARGLGPFNPTPDAGAGVDASADIGTCDGKATGTGTGKAGTPSGLIPSSYVKAYNIPTTPTGAGNVIAIVDACAETNVVADLAAYRAQFGLPALPECGGAAGTAPTPGGTACFGVVSQRGDATLPPGDSGWAGEIALDVEMASAACPACSILLVEADSPNSWDLGPAENEAVTLGANAVSNSFGSTEDPNDPFGTAFSDGPYAQYFEHDGVLIAVASGDDSYNNENATPVDDAGITLAPSFPATIPSVLSVGGTELRTSTTSTRGYTETVWPGSTSGCSTEFPKPAYQSSVSMGTCTMRGDVDVAAAASGVSTYLGGRWENGVGGTSCASPFVAALLTRLGVANQPNAFFYANSAAFYDVTTGTNDDNCSSVMCQAGPGWDGTTGWGSPNGAVLAALDGGSGAAAPDASTSIDGGGLADGAAPVPEAGPIVLPDLDATTDDAGTEPGAPGSGAGKSGGCGCETPGASSSLPWAPSGVALLALGAFVAVKRRRRA